MKKMIYLAVVLTATGVPGVFADVLTQVPMQGSMAMPMVLYGAASGTISVTMPSAVPQLTSMLVSNPSDSFDPSAPWFSALDARAQGESFSRRYGFNMDPSTDLLPATNQIWIRKLAGPADLKFYNYSSSAPGTFNPVFGTDGSTNAVYWSGVMWHPVVTAPPGTNHYTATFEVYLVDTTTGQEVASSSSGPLTFNWTDVPDGRPALSLSLTPNVAVTWPATTTTNWVLLSAANLNAATWTLVTNAPVTVNGQLRVILDQNAAQQFFRMSFQP